MSAANSVNEVILEVLDRYVPEVLKTMAGLVATPGKGDANAPQPTNLSGISGAIGLSGSANGIVYTAFSENLAQAAAEAILGGSASQQDVNDVVAELTNMITGNLKSHLCDAGYNCSLSIPSVVRGEVISVSAKAARISVENSYTIEGIPGTLVLRVFAILIN